MTTTTPVPYNFSIEAIPAAFAYGLVPHLYVTSRLLLATKGRQSLTMPRTNLETSRSLLPESLYKHLTRVRGAHLNSVEVFPLFAAAMVAGNMAGLPAQDMNNYALSFFGARTLYMGVYATISRDALAFVRSGVYAWSVVIPGMVLWRAGKKMATDV